MLAGQPVLRGLAGCYARVMGARGPAPLGPRRVTLRVAAALLLAVIGLDIASDTTCDLGYLVRSAALEYHASDQAGGDPCGEVCIPDCFCCARSVPTAAVLLVPRPLKLAALDPLPGERWPEGVRPVVDHPPHSRG